MAFTLVQAGTQLYPVNTDGALGAALTLPNGIALTATRVPRFAKFKNYVVLVNTPSKPVCKTSKQAYVSPPLQSCLLA